jgi:hypothetical protein
VNQEHIRNPRRAAAGRFNGILAKGRKSAEGRARSAQNAIKHHLSAKNYFLLPTEDPAAYEEIYSTLEATYAPQDAAEYTMVGEIIACEWKLARIEALEATAITVECEKVIKNSSTIPNSEHVCDADLVLWRAMQNLESNSAFRMLFRYRAQYERTRNRALKNLETYRALTKLAPVELESESPTPNPPEERYKPALVPVSPSEPKPHFDKTKVTDPYPLL